MSSLLTPSIDAATAWTAIDAAAAKAKELRLRISIAIVDPAGDLKAFHRMDGAPKLTLQIAQDKAYTSAGLGLPTHVWYDRIKDDPPLLHGLTHTPRFVIFGGGYPIRENGALIGAIGISGGHYSQDMECARAALDAVGAEVS
jgi:uncharacterized protein GlcG (DUF336 family)